MIVSTGARKSLLRLSVCGGARAGDGESTLIGRLLGSAAPNSPGEATAGQATAGDASHGTVSFSTERRDVIVAVATPHQPQAYARDLVSGAPPADVSVLLVDAQKGLEVETRRHSFLATLFGVRQVVLAVNQMDRVGYSQEVFTRIEGQYRTLATELGVPAVACIPISAAVGDNVRAPSAAMPWWQGPTLMGLLDGVEADEERLGRQPLRLRVSDAGTGTGAGTGAGTILAGRLRKGDAVRIQPSGRLTGVARIARLDIRGGEPAGTGAELAEAGTGQAISFALEDQIAVARGDLIVPANQPAEVADQFEATVIWTSKAPLLPGRSYLLTIGGTAVTATVAPLKYLLNPSDSRRMAAARLRANEIGVCNLQLDRPIAFDPYSINRHTGGFVLGDPLTQDVLGAGMLHFALRRAQNVHWQVLDVNKAVRAAAKQQRPCVLWYTGFSGAGKSTIANLVDKKLHSLNRHTYLLDGDNVRHGLNKDLGFTDADRVENIRRIAEVAKLMVDAGLIVGTAFISPFRAERQTARALLAQGEFIEVFIDTPLEVAEGRDPKGLYKKARRGDLKNFTGIDSPYEAPQNPEIRIDTTATAPEDAAELIVSYLRARGMLDPT